MAFQTPQPHDESHMATVSTRPSSGPARREQLSTRIAFFIAGFGMAAWAPLVPFAKARVGVGEGALGLLLLCLGIGSIVTMPFAGALAARIGCRVVITVSALLLCLSRRCWRGSPTCRCSLWCCSFSVLASGRSTYP